jgi:hypothetical protein
LIANSAAGVLGGGETKVIDPETQTAHGFVVGQSVTFNTGTQLWELNDNSDPTKLSWGVVSAVEDDDHFTVTTYGLMTWTAHGLDLGAEHFCDPDNPGDYTTTKPESGYITMKLIPKNANQVFVYDYPTVEA